MRASAPAARRRLFSREGVRSTGHVALLFACLSVFVAGGLPYGMSALFPVLYSEGVLAQQCGTAAARECAAEQRTTKCCDAQMLSYTLLSSAAMMPSDALVALYGEYVDRRGPRKTFLLGMAFACAGLAILALNTQLHSEPLWFAAFLCLGSSGPGVFFSILFLTEKYNELQPLITTLSSATFDGSAICFYVFNALYFVGGLRLSTIALIWLTLCLALGAATHPLLPTWTWLKEEREKARAAQQRTRLGGDASRTSGNSSIGEEDSSKWLFGSSSKSLLDASGGGNSGSGYLEETLLTMAPSSGGGMDSNGGGVSRDGSTTTSLLEGGVVNINAGGSGGSCCSPPQQQPQPSVTQQSNNSLTEPLLRQQQSGPATPGTPAADPLFRALQYSFYGDPETGRGSPTPLARPLNAAETARLSAAALAPAPSPAAEAAPAAAKRPPPPPPRLSDQMLRADSLLLMATMSIANLKATYYIVSVSEELRALFPSSTAAQLDTVFNVAFPLGALITSPLASMLLKRYRKQPHVYMSVALLAQHCFGLCTLFTHALPQLLGALLFGPARTLLWSSYFHYLAQPRRYPRALAGRTLGYCNLVIAIASDAPLYLINSLVDWASGGDEHAKATGYRFVQVAIQVALVGCLAFPVYLYRMRRDEILLARAQRASEDR